MRRTAAALTVLAGLVFALAFPSVANASTGWIEDGSTVVTNILVDGNGTQYAKIVTRVELFIPTNSTLLTDVTATRAACSIRNLNYGVITGVLVDECAIGINGSTINDNTGDATDGGGCCANSYSFIRNIYYYSGGHYLRARGTYKWRYKSSGVLDGRNFLSDPTDTVWLLN